MAGIMNNGKVVGSSADETQRRFAAFERIRGKHTSNFWDVVIITAADDAQKCAFQEQVNVKLSSGELPLSPEYLVLSDPPGFKIGNGGSTLVVLECLHEKYGESYTSKKTIVIHAGGFSQRLPTASVMGKVFAAFPTREPIYQMLEIKLASYIDLPSKIVQGGVFVCCSDTLEVYNDADVSWTFHQTGITGLAHPSSIEIGTTHGVYLLHDMSSLLVKCKRFLHKPSAGLMRSTDGCVLCLPHDEGAQELVLTDSAFFMAPDVCNILLKFYKSVKPLKCEIDAYGDFLQALGSEADSSYTRNTQNVVNESTSLVQSRKQIFDALRGTELHVVALVPNSELGDDISSHFYHFGTSSEYLQLLTDDPQLDEVVGAEVVSFCAGTPYMYTASEAQTTTSRTPKASTSVDDVVGGLMGTTEEKQPINRVPKIMACVLNARVTVGEGSVLEFCTLRERVSIGSECIVSSCLLQPGTWVPRGTILHTVAVNVAPDSVAYVTVAFGVRDNMKLSAPRDEALAVVSYFGTPLKDLLTDTVAFGAVGDGAVSLWHARLFPARQTMEDSSQATCSWISRIVECSATGTKCSLLDEKEELYSMADILRIKNVRAMLRYRKELIKEIRDTRFDQTVQRSDTV